MCARASRCIFIMIIDLSPNTINWIERYDSSLVDAPNEMRYVAALYWCVQPLVLLLERVRSSLFRSPSVRPCLLSSLPPSLPMQSLPRARARALSLSLLLLDHIRTLHMFLGIEMRVVRCFIGGARCFIIATLRVSVKGTLRRLQPN